MITTNDQCMVNGYNLYKLYHITSCGLYECPVAKYCIYNISYCHDRYLTAYFSLSNCGTSIQVGLFCNDVRHQTVHVHIRFANILYVWKNRYLTLSLFPPLLMPVFKLSLFPVQPIYIYIYLYICVRHINNKKLLLLA